MQSPSLWRAFLPTLSARAERIGPRRDGQAAESRRGTPGGSPPRHRQTTPYPAGGSYPPLRSIESACFPPPVGRRQIVSVLVVYKYTVFCIKSKGVSKKILHNFSGRNADSSGQHHETGRGTGRAARPSPSVLRAYSFFCVYYCSAYRDKNCCVRASRGCSMTSLAGPCSTMTPPSMIRMHPQHGWHP